MKEFTDLLKKHRPHPDNVSINTITPMTGGYLLAVVYAWNDSPKDILEEAVFIVDEQHGPKQGQMRIGWTHKIHEYTEEND